MKERYEIQIQRLGHGGDAQSAIGTARCDRRRDTQMSIFLLIVAANLEATIPNKFN